jgi:ribosome assembly protein YihI (activator of Der GTPase)
MESRKRARRGTAPGSVVSQLGASEGLLLANIAALIDNGGQITLGALHPIACVAIANDDHNSLAMLQRRPRETLQQLLQRLDAAIDLAWNADQFTDEINRPPSDD